MPLGGFTPYNRKDAEKYNRMRWWLGMTWGDVFDRATDLYPDKIGLVDDTGRWTYGELRATVDRLAIGFMKLGIMPGDRVFIQIPNWHEYIYCFFALQKIGAVPVLLVPRHNQIEIRHLYKLTEPVAWILPAQYGKIEYQPIIDDVLKESPKIKHIIQVRADNTRYHKLEKLIADGEPTEENLLALEQRRPDPDQVAQIMPTGGTTGLPKASPRTHNNYINNVEYHAYRWELTSDDVLMVVTPVAHGMGLHWGIGGAVFRYAKLVLLDSVAPEAICETVQREKVTAIPTVPALIARVVQMEDLQKYDLSSLKKISVGGAPSTPELVKTVYEKIGCQFINGFGSVEGTCAGTKLGDSIELICGSVGTPVCPYDNLKIVDTNGNEVAQGTDGELVSKGPGIFTGYFKSPEENANIFTTDGFFKTGDQARKDEYGNIWITGRIKDIIIRGGENISAVEIEGLISVHPDVRDVAVVGMPDKILGERICAYIIPSVGKKPTLQEIVLFLKGRGASVLQLPERLELVEELPLTKVGKVDKKALRADIQKKVEGEA
ncbi:MAG TPA: AMP-binding protein [Syntrophorhabdales bacterium]|nr:AMP-binding protein [Syntrophorhabdales bacterium]